MVATAAALAAALNDDGIPVHRFGEGFTTTHQFAVEAAEWGGGHRASLHMREANLLACAIGLPGGDEWTGLRLGTPEIVRWGMTPGDMPELAGAIRDALRDDPRAAAKVSDLRSRFRSLHYINR
jgi:glycine hydroxymethyltransferase